MVNNKVAVCDKTSVDGLQTDALCMPGDLKMRANTEFFEDEKTRTQSLSLLRSMLMEEANLRWQNDDAFLLAFLRARKFNVEKALCLIKNMYTTFGKHANIYYTLTLDHLRSMMEENCFCILPRTHDDGSIVAILRFGTLNPTSFSVEERLVMVSLGLLHALRKPSAQLAGIRMIVDFNGFTFKHFLQATPSSMYFLHEIIQKTIPLRVKSIHITNQNVFFPYMWNIFKNFLSKKLRDRVYIHGKDMDSLHRFINPKILPAEFKGSQPAFDNTEWRKAMEASSDYTTLLLSHGYKKHMIRHQTKSIGSIKSNHLHT